MPLEVTWGLALARRRRTLNGRTPKHPSRWTVAADRRADRGRGRV